jgi:hypothetical protein
VAESLQHVRLVERAIVYIKRVYGPLYALVVMHDLPGQLGGDHPPRIGGYVPDIYALDAPPSIIIIGEAKTHEDLDTEHSRRQFFAFLKYANQQSSGVFILAVPWQVAATARNLLQRLTRQQGLERVRIVVIDDVQDKVNA